MIRVTIELLPFGDETGKKTLSVIEIANQQTGSMKYGDYMARLNPKDEWTRDVVVGWTRFSGVNGLVMRVLKYFAEKGLIE